jgi:hypothetical protein
MRQIYNAGVTPQEKIVAVNKRFGNTGIKSQQGTSRIIYDSLPVTNNGQTTFRFYEDSSSRAFPFTNTGSDGNKLGVGDTMVLGSVLFYAVQRATATGIFSATQVNLVSLPGITLSIAYFNFEIANNQVVKKVTLSEANSFYNNSTSTFATNLELETEIVIPPLLPYVLELRTPESLYTTLGAPSAGHAWFVFAQIIGVGGIIAPRTTF